MTRWAVVWAMLTAMGAIPPPAISAPRARSIHLEITLPNGSMTQVIVRDGEGASVRLSDRSAYGFVPTIRDEDKTSTVVVAIWIVDEVPNRQLGEVAVVPGGGAVTSETSPRFAIRVVRVLKAK